MKTMNFAILLSLLATSAGAETASIPVNLVNRKDVILGTGYDTRDQVLRGACVDNDPDTGKKTLPDIGQATGSFDLHLQKDESKVADKLAISGEGRYQSGPVKVSAAADFLNETSKNDFNLSYTFASEHFLRESMSPSRALPIRPSKGFEKYASSAKEWTGRCGDEFVQARIKTARLFVNVTLSFVSKAEKMRFYGKAGVETPVMELKAAIESNHEAFSSGNRMSVQAIQIGGDTSKLGRIVCPRLKSDGKPDPECVNGARAVANCSFGKIDQCVEMIANAVAYSNAEDGDNFPKQIAAGKNYVTTSLETQPYYPNLGDPFVRPSTDERVTLFKAARERVINVFKKEHKNWVYSDQLFGGQAPRLSIAQRDVMEGLRNEIFEGMKAAADAIDTCYDGTYEQCNKTYAEVAKKIGIDKNPSIYDTQYAKIQSLTLPETFVQYCDVADNDHPAIQRTVKTLRSFAEAALGENAKAIKDGDTCFNLALWLDGQKSIELVGSGQNTEIGDLAPIATLKNLESLKITKMGIKSIEALKALTNLKKLNLDDNRIDDISPLTELKNLEFLSVQNNLIGQPSMQSLSKLNGSLKKLDARGNQEGVTCPLTNTASCKIMSFSDYANISSAYTKCDETMQHQAAAIDDTYIVATGGRAFPAKSGRIQLVSNEGCRVLPKELAVPRVGHTMVATPNGILVIGGGTNKIELLDPKTLAPVVLPGVLAENATNHTSTLLPDGRVLVVGGASDADANTAMLKPQALSGLVQVIGLDGKVEVIGRLAVPRSEHSATLLADGTVLVLGGYSLNKMIDIVERIDPVKKTISTLADTLPTGRSGHTAMALQNGHVLIAGGAIWDPQATVRTMKMLSDLIDFDPNTNKFRVIDEKFSAGVTKMQAIATSDNRVLLVGGVLDSVPMEGSSLRVQTAAKDIQVYDPNSEALYKVAEMLDRRLGFTATAVGRNSVLIFGGSPSWTFNKETKKMDQGKLTTWTEFLVYRPR